MKEEKTRNVIHAKTCLHTHVQTKLYSLHCFVFLVIGARFEFFLSVMQCLHFVLPFLYFRRDGTYEFVPLTDGHSNT